MKNSIQKGQQQQQVQEPEIIVEKRKYFVGGNWKSNGNVSFVREMINEVLNKVKFDQKKMELLVCPMVVHIPSAKAMLNSNVMVGCQNISATASGAYTGEVNAEQVKDFGLGWVIIGHSERRTLFDETNEVVSKKLDRAQEQGLNAILCVGEKLEERENGSTQVVVKAQLDAFKSSIKDWTKIVIAYEPVWAVGTGKTATPEVAQEAHEFIRKWIEQNSNLATAQATRVVYGGSVNEVNAEVLIAQKDIDGFLVGSASLKISFQQIIETVNKAA